MVRLAKQQCTVSFDRERADGRERGTLKGMNLFNSAGRAEPPLHLKRAARSASLHTTLPQICTLVTRRMDSRINGLHKKCERASAVVREWSVISPRFCSSLAKVGGIRLIIWGPFS